MEPKAWATLGQGIIVAEPHGQPEKNLMQSDLQWGEVINRITNKYTAFANKREEAVKGKPQRSRVTKYPLETRLEALHIFCRRTVGCALSRVLSWRPLFQAKDTVPPG